MKVSVLGGAGEVGSEVTRDLAQCREIDQIVVADLDGKRAAQIASELPHSNGNAPIAVQVDVRDHPQALQALAGADLLMNCTTFALFDEVFELAIEARIDYADLISEPTEAQRRRAEAAGITAISGLGATPGLSNILVRHASEELDEIHEVHISWVSLRTVAPSPGLLDTILWELSEDCPTRQYFQNGHYHRAAFLDGSRLVEFAPPVGRQRVYYVPHTEVSTLPRHFPTLRFCGVRGTWRPDLMEDMRVLQHYGLLQPSALETTKRTIWERFGGQRDASPWMLYVNVEVIGTLGGVTLRRTYDASHPPEWGQGGVARMTGIPAAVGAQLLARHGRAAAGFVDPEVYYDPHEFLDELAKRDSVSVRWRQQDISETRVSGMRPNIERSG
jgi:lysine 6-dehydrogenase